MANARKQNVLIIDTTGQIDGDLKICSIKLVSSSDASTLTVKADSTSGAVVWAMKAGANVDATDTDIKLTLPGGAYFTLSGTSPVAYIVVE